MSPRWWLTLARSEGLCSDCGKYHRPREPLLFEPATRRVICTTCGDERGIEAPPSRAYRSSSHNGERPAVTGRATTGSLGQARPQGGHEG